MKILITGAAGFVGKYCIDYFKSQKYEVFATKLENEKINSDCNVINMDLTDINSVEQAIKISMPDLILHLAAQSSVALSWKNPQLTADINFRGTINLLESVRKYCYDINNINTKILLAGSGEEYGYLPKDIKTVNEKTQLHPGNIYAVTKIAQNMTGAVYARAYNMNIFMTRAFNHIGPGQLPVFVASDFAKQVAEIEAGEREPVIKTGDLTAVRDFCDVRDVVRAYDFVLNKGIAGKTYNIGSGKGIKIKELLDKIISRSDKKIIIEQDKNKLRPSEVPVSVADITAIEQDTGWKPIYNIDKTLDELLEWWRNKKGGAVKR